MLTIRQDQVETFRQYHLQKFEDEMVEHLKGFAPRHWKAIGEQTGREVIQLGIQQGEKYGFTNRGPVRFYIELMFMFGSYFDTDPQLPWVAEVLNDPSPLGQMVRADRLFAAMGGYIKQVPGPAPDYQHLHAAMQRLSEARIEQFVVPREDPADVILLGLRSIYPQKCEYLRESVLRSVIAHGFRIGSQYGLATDRGNVLMAMLAFFVGHGFPVDRQYDWIVARLNHPRRPDPAGRVEELYSKAMLYLKHALAA